MGSKQKNNRISCIRKLRSENIVCPQLRTKRLSRLEQLALSRWRKKPSTIWVLIFNKASIQTSLCFGKYATLGVDRGSKISWGPCELNCSETKFGYNVSLGRSENWRYVRIALWMIDDFSLLIISSRTQSLIVKFSVIHQKTTEISPEIGLFNHTRAPVTRTTWASMWHVGSDWTFFVDRSDLT